MTLDEKEKWMKGRMREKERVNEKKMGKERRRSSQRIFRKLYPAALSTSSFAVVGIDEVAKPLAATKPLGFLMNIKIVACFVVESNRER